jgi:glycosyltransferase involved in cell wall biosynthesis
MNVISISTDRKIFEKNGVVRKRMIEHGAVFDELHIIIFAKESLKAVPEKISNSVWVYPTHSRSKLRYMKDAEKIAKDIIQKRGFAKENTVVTCQDPFETSIVGVRLKKRFGFSFQIQIHTDFLSPYFTSFSFLNRIRVYLAKRHLKYADEIRAVSLRIKKSLTPWNISPGKIDVLPVHTDFEKYTNIEKPLKIDVKKNYPQFETCILMASRLNQEKNIGSALKILQELLYNYPKTGLIIVGEGPEKNNLIKMTEKLGLRSNVIFEPWQHDLASYYASADIFLSTSFYEGYGLTIIEAGLSGACIVMSDVGIAGDIIEDSMNGSVCPVNDVKSFAEAISNLISNPKIRQKYTSRIRQDILKNIIVTKEEYTERYKKLLEKALGSQTF